MRRRGQVFQLLGAVSLMAALAVPVWGSNGPRRSSSPAHKALRLRVVPPPRAGRALAGLRALHVTMTGASPAPMQVGSGSMARLLSGACASPGTYLLSSASLVSCPFRVTQDVCRGAALTVHLFPRATIQIHVRPAAGTKLPKAAMLKLAACPKGLVAHATAHAAWLPLPIPGSRTVRAVVPSGCLDLSLVTKRFAPVSWWGLKAVAGKTKDLGTAQLKTGASLLVQTIDADDRWPLAGARVSLVDAGHVKPAIRAALKGTFPAGFASGVSVARGWLRLAGLPDGVYTLLATAKGHAVACKNVVLAAGKETVVDDLQIGRPGSLDISVGLDPSTIPDGYHLVLSLQPTLCCRHLPGGTRLVKVPDSGFVHMTGLNPGQWEIDAMLMTSAGLAYDVGSARAVVASGSGGNAELDIHGALYHGTVTQGGEPLEADLRFVRKNTNTSGSVQTCSSRPDGSFTVFLPHPGLYHVDVRLPHRGTEIPVAGVTVKDPATPLAIKVPSGTIQGAVVDEEDAPVPDATIEASSRPPAAHSEALFAQAESGEDGTFTVEGVASGTWSVSARRQDLASAPAVVTVSKGQEAPWVKLVVRKMFTQKGRVVMGDQSPASGVFIAAWNASAVSRGAAPAFFSATSRADGSFTLRVPGQAGDVINVAFAAVGVAANAVRLRLSRTPWTLHASHAGGRLDIVFPGPRGSAAMSVFALVRRDGAVLLFNAFAHGGLSLHPAKKSAVVTIEDLAAGPWQAVWTGSPAATRAILSGAGIGLPSRGSVSITSGTTERITFAAPQ